MTTTMMTKAEFLASKPAWAAAAIIARYETDACDLYTDLFMTRTERTVVIGWSKHKRDLFPELRKAAATFSETADLATASKDAEHREKYSMGRGFYLKGSRRYSTGWLVKKIAWFASLSGDTVEVAVPATSVAAAA